MKLLLIDDEAALLQYRRSFLESKGCAVDTAKNAAEAIGLLSGSEYACIVLDVMLEETEGYDLCRQIKAITNAPVIFLSNLSDEESQAKGLLCGGDDYILKSCGLELFWLKITKRVELHETNDEAAIMDFSPLIIDQKKRKITMYGNEVLLTGLEFDLLAVMASLAMKIWSTEELYGEVWGMDAVGQTQTVQVHVSRLRGKLEKACPQHYFLQTVWKKGYKFVPAALEKYSI